jgi:formate hydrogenlyase transcriptional activator
MGATVAFTDLGSLAEAGFPMSDLEDQQVCLESGISPEHCFEGIIGKSPAIQKVLEQVAIVAPTDSTVLLHGETGTGKELVAQAIHKLSSRCERTLVRMNCAAIPSGLLESELFGHEKGAFTGALIQRKGRFELADRGSLFLDEIGDISLEVQPKLLRAVQEQEFERLGSARTIQVNVRMIAATHRDLSAMIREQEFREDLFYRFNVFPIEIPPLRERREDIPLLVHFFVSRFSRRMKKCIRSIQKKVPDMRSLARETGLTPHYVRNVFSCAFLAPDIVVAILEGRQPLTLKFEHLYKNIPLSWAEQRQQFGFTRCASNQVRSAIEP